jgi:SAM-dependent methyltransferase
LDASSEPPSVTAARMTMGHWVAQCVSVACELRIPELVAKDPRTADDLATECRADPAAMLRFLRALGSLGILAQADDGRFEATPLSEQFRQDVPGFGPYARFITSSEVSRAWGELLEAVRTSRTVFDAAFGLSFFDYLAEHPDRGQIFNRAMTASSQTVSEELLGTYDFSGFRTIIDVGGGQGLLLAAILRRYPEARGVLFDLPHVLDQPKELLEEAGVADRCSVVDGDFFQSVPSGGDAYVLKSIIHDWDDERARRVLSNCRKAMPPHGRVLVVDRVIPERLEPSFVNQRGTLMDLNMLVLTGGRERTKAEFKELFESSGLMLRRFFPTPTGLHVIEAIRNGIDIVGSP